MHRNIFLVGVLSLTFGTTGCVFSDEGFRFDEDEGLGFGDEFPFDDPDPDPDDATSVVTEPSDGPFSQPVDDVSDANRRRFERGRELFRLEWSPEQVGPVFNAFACSECHARDGRGTPEGVGTLFRLSVPGPADEPVYGGQLQPRGMLAPGEGVVLTRWEESRARLEDGTEVELRRPRYDFLAPGYGPFDEALQFSPRLAQQTFGLGFLESIPEEAILARVDEDDADKDGVSGRANWVEDARDQSVALGRFGWKAGQPTLEQQNAAAFAGDLGMTSSLFPDGPCTGAQQACLDVDSGETELSDEQLAFVTRYTRLLAPPARRDVDAEDVRRGERLFEEAGCDTCHVPQWETGDVHLDELSNRTFEPYTDLLLHDMGAGLADRRPEANADGREWRTPPLWGIGLLGEVNGHTFLLHDGRARDVTEAILWHGGEGFAARQAFATMSADQRSDLVRFVESL